MAFKILGSIIVIVTFGVFGFYFSYKPIYRQNDLLEMKRAILILSSEIKFLSTSIIEAIEQIESTISAPIRNIFSYFKILLEKKQGESIEKLWELALKTESKSTYLERSDLDKLRMIGSSVCNYDKELNLNSLEMIADYIDQAIEEINKDKKKNLKMYQSLSILLGAMIVILLI